MDKAIADLPELPLRSTARGQSPILRTLSGRWTAASVPAPDRRNILRRTFKVAHED